MKSLTMSESKFQVSLQFFQWCLTIFHTCANNAYILLLCHRVYKHKLIGKAGFCSAPSFSFLLLSYKKMLSSRWKKSLSFVNFIITSSSPTLTQKLRKTSSYIPHINHFWVSEWPSAEEKKADQVMGIQVFLQETDVLINCLVPWVPNDKDTSSWSPAFLSPTPH